MDSALVISALVTGFLGSAHCIGMCGPIALALPLGFQSSRYPRLLLYHSGRAVTYAMLGSIPGLLGVGLQWVGLSRWISIGLGALLLLMVLLGWGRRLEALTTNWRVMAVVRQQIGKWFAKSGYQHVFVIGLLNGLLPCGLVYTALLISIGTGTIWGSAAFMFIFGLATLPAMFTLSALSHVINASFRRRVNRLVPYTIALMAILMIVRGLNLGIPYISPSIKETGEVECCERR
jgi:sulfite exporter TauE/SafE